MDCAQARTQADQSINNVRARLLTGGDVWWDGNANGSYIIPKVEPGSGAPERSSIFAGAVWLGGVDDANILRVAAQTYGSSRGLSDFWPGPLTDEGVVDAETCNDWDRMFTILGSEIEQHQVNYLESVNSGTDYDPDLIPDNVKYWPARGNPFFFEEYEFALPNNSQGLAAFHDQDGDELYDPSKGDYPVIEVAGCDAKGPIFADEMFFWIYNDAGGIHTQTGGEPIRMEIQVQAFAFATNDEINNMSFQRYKLINRAVGSIDSMYFAMWVDPDLGCYLDDYIGCDSSRSLAFIYNQDITDGEPGCSCPDGVETYCNDVPALGVDYFRGPRNEFFEELGMSSFMYYNNNIGGVGPTTDPENAVEFYRYLTGSWRDGTPLTKGGSGYNVTSTDYTNYAFTGLPNDNSDWSMCSEGLPSGDRRTIQATGPFRLDPGAVNELIIGAVWVPFADYPCPGLSGLLAADDLAQGLFDNCFELLEGPDAPNLNWLEMDQEIIAVLSNPESPIFNNTNEEYTEVDIFTGEEIADEDKTYVFEGYQLYQLRGPGVGSGDLSNPDLARVVETVDIKNGVKDLFNWRGFDNPSQNVLATDKLWDPTLMNENAQDEGIKHTFRITEDLFAESNRRLINHKNYYYMIVAYGYNNYEDFVQLDNGELIGQRTTYLPGRKNIRRYTVTPRPITNVRLNSAYGDGTIITRLDGEGAGGNYLKVDKQMREAMISPDFDDRITYLPGQAPIGVSIYNPLGVIDGRFRLEFFDEEMSDDELEVETYWKLTNLDNQDEVFSDQTIERLNEQLLPAYGFSVKIEQTEEAGQLTPGNGAIGGSISYEDDAEPWLNFLTDQEGSGNSGLFNFVRTGFNEKDSDQDPEQDLTNVLDGTFVPFKLSCYELDVANPVLSPAWVGSNGRNLDKRLDLEDLNNVDIVLTPDKSKWSRCVVVESASELWTRAITSIQTEGNVEQFALRPVPSVSKEDADGDGLPDPDGELDADGDARMGMGWFPGYAVDVETGQRLNIFFGENSLYRPENDDFFGGPDVYVDPPLNGKRLGNDMMWNPNGQLGLQANVNSLVNIVAGGHHFIYVTQEPYDEGEATYQLLKRDRAASTINALKLVTWTAIPLVRSENLRSYADGLVPSEAVIELRVDNPFDVEMGTNENDGYPAYEFSFEGVEAAPLVSRGEIDGQLDAINIVPNPYYGYSNYELTELTRHVKVTNLPAKCTVTIYSLDGKFIRNYKRDLGENAPIGSNPGILVSQIEPDLIWDLNNHKGIPVASGTYLVHIAAPGLGERVLKWFGIGRQFDPSRF
ncbi:MAG: hypothetical protein AAFV95_05405 [Bacteroidota bacterium]